MKENADMSHAQTRRMEQMKTLRAEIAALGEVGGGCPGLSHGALSEGCYEFRGS